MDYRNFVWLAVAAAVGVYATMVFWSIPIIVSQAGGLAVFDMRPMGYSFDEAKAFLTALSTPGKWFYLDVQQFIDTVFPIFLMTAMAPATILLAPQGWKAWRYVLALPIVFGGIFDLAENYHVAVMLHAGAEKLTDDMVAAASFFTVVKSVFVTLGSTILLVVLAMWFLRAKRGALPDGKA